MAIDDWRDCVGEVDPTDIADPDERALLVFAQWHYDEDVDDQDALDYAQGLATRLEEAGLRIVVG